MKILLVLIFGFIALPASAQQVPAPFGLTWLASAQEIETLGVKLTEVTMADFGESYSATSLPKALSDLETVVLSFGYDDQLYRVGAISREFENDQYGIRVRERYEELRTALSRTYKAGTQRHVASTDSFFGKPDNFLYSLYKGEAYWYSLFSSSEADIELSLDATGSSDGYWRVIYTHRAAASTFAQGKSEKETDAL